MTKLNEERKSEKSFMPISMEWMDLLFIHWEVDPILIQKYLPDGVKVDTFEGKGYLGIVPFVMNKLTFSQIPFLFTPFPEINVRTYIKVGDVPGIYILHVTLNSKLGLILSKGYEIEYNLEKLMISRIEQDITITSNKFNCICTPGSEHFFARKGSLEYWLTERYRLYLVKKDGNILYEDISHEQWTLQEASISLKKNSLFDQLPFPMPSSEPHVLYSKGMSVKGKLLKKVKG